MKSYILLLIVLFSFSIYAQSQTDDYLTLLDNVFYQEEAQIRMDVYKNEKLMKYYEMDFYRKNNIVRMDFTGPAVEKGRRMLDDEKNLWMYMPRTSKVMKVPLKQTFMGSDASNRDVFRLNFSNDYELASNTPGEGNMIILELKAKDHSVAYSKVLVYFDKNEKTPVKQEMYTLSGKHIKTIKYEENITIEGKRVPTVMIITDELQKNTYTRIHYHTFKIRSDKAAEFFTLGSIKR